MIRYPYLLACALAALPLTTLGAQSDAPEPMHHYGAEQLGVVHFANSGNAAAQKPFVRGVAFLHSFHYDESARAFQAAERADTSFALPYWLEAFGHSQILWSVEDLPSARKVLARLGPTPEARLRRAKTARERGYGAAIEAFLADTSPSLRTRAFADSMTALAARYPHDLDAAAFASLALMLEYQEKGYTSADSALILPRALTLAERVFHANPNHPGAAHYLIHLADFDVTLDNRVLPAALAYARIAPDASHALHMPSHVFLPLGRWDDVAHSNERSFAATRKEALANHEPGSSIDAHSLEWLAYAYVQQGRWHAARALIDTARKIMGNADLSADSLVDARYIVSNIAFIHAMESGDWTHAVMPPAPVAPRTVREASFVGSGIVQQAEIAGMHGDTATLSAGMALLRPRAVPGRYLANMGLHVLEGMLARARGDTAGAIAHWKTGLQYQAFVRPVGPPNALVPSDLLGELLLAHGDAKGAADQFRFSLSRTPNRSSALRGLARACKASHDDVCARDAYRKLSLNWKHADADLPALAEVRAGAR